MSTLFFSSTLVSGLQNDSYKVSSAGTINYQISVPPDEVYCGFALPSNGIIGSLWTREHFRKIKSWGFKDVLIDDIWWGRFVSQGGTYRKTRFARLDEAVQWARSEGLNVGLSLRVCWDPTPEGADTSWWTDWSYDEVRDEQMPSHDYVNLEDEGRERYASFVEFIVQRYPNCFYSLWHFPYHKQGVDSVRRNRFYAVTFPTLLGAVRKYSNNTIVFVPIHQGMSGNGEVASYYETATPLDDPNIVYGLGHCMPWNVVDWGSWDYDFNRLDEAFEGIRRFRETYDLPMFSVEFTPLRWSGNIDESRLACLEEVLKRTFQYEVGWAYHRISASKRSGDNIIEDINDFEANLFILTLLQENRG